MGQRGAWFEEKWPGPRGQQEGEQAALMGELGAVQAAGQQLDGGAWGCHD